LRAAARPGESDGQRVARPRPEPMLGVEPPSRGPPAPLSQLPVWSYPFVAIATIMIVSRLFKRMKRLIFGGPGSLGSVRERGFSYEDSAGYNEQYFRDVMKRINTKPVERISEEQILAARERRRQELQEERVDLDEIEIPKEHPWAVKESTTPEEQEEIRKRLSARRGMDPSSPRAQRARGRMMDGAA